mmetsp:Transcript_12088/g.51921  ORF Transcript_12088/g.51921 Transcript_12088/m.51921 type:complete len:221 (+) Transcript_12088:2466-3128(+)
MRRDRRLGRLGPGRARGFVGTGTGTRGSRIRRRLVSARDQILRGGVRALHRIHLRRRVLGFLHELLERGEALRERPRPGEVLLQHLRDRRARRHHKRLVARRRRDDAFLNPKLIRLGARVRFVFLLGAGVQRSPLLHHLLAHALESLEHVDGVVEYGQRDVAHGLQRRLERRRAVANHQPHRKHRPVSGVRVALRGGVPAPEAPRPELARVARAALHRGP